MKPEFRLYLITGRKSVKNKKLEDAVEEALQGGVRAVQLREKDMPVRELLQLALRLREITNGHKARLFINDRVDVAELCRADGVHLGGQSMPVQAVRKMCGDKKNKKLMIGVSAHTVEEALSAQKGGADFVTFGPVFDTPSKRAYGTPLGLQKLKEAASVLEIPVFAIGGIKTGNIESVMDAGAFGAALISGIFGADDIKGEAGLFMEALK